MLCVSNIPTWLSVRQKADVQQQQLCTVCVEKNKKFQLHALLRFEFLARAISYVRPSSNEDKGGQTFDVQYKYTRTVQ